METSLTFLKLQNYIREKMRMSHIYQPVMLRVLLERRGEASIEEIARALLSYDISQVEYYEIRVKRMVGKVLTQRGIVTPIKEHKQTKKYKLNLNIDSLTKSEMAILTQLCDDRLREFLKNRQENIWKYNGAESRYLPGSVRYEVLKRAKSRCELCGAHDYEKALHIDHIVPKAHGGSDDIDNLQVLCVTCNSNKRDEDNTDFRGVLNSYQDRDPSCLFCKADSLRVIAESELCYAARNKFSITPEHTLVIPKRHVTDYFDIYQPEQNAIYRMLREQRRNILERDGRVTGFKVGVDTGGDSGQAVLHAHVHLIPRRPEDVIDPHVGL